MWILITDCGKQLTIHSKVREKHEDHITLYEIVVVESDQYKLKLLERDHTPPSELKLNCLQLIQYGFEVEVNDKVV